MKSILNPSPDPKVHRAPHLRELTRQQAVISLLQTLLLLLTHHVFHTGSRPCRHVSKSNALTHHLTNAICISPSALIPLWPFPTKCLSPNKFLQHHMHRVRESRDRTAFFKTLLTTDWVKCPGWLQQTNHSTTSVTASKYLSVTRTDRKKTTTIPLPSFLRSSILQL